MTASAGAWVAGLALALGLAATPVACGSSSGSGSNTPEDGGGNDATLDALDAGGQAEASGHDAADAAPDRPTVCDHTVTNPACWSGLDVTSAAGGITAFFGAAYDGHAVYVVGSFTGVDATQVKVVPGPDGGASFSAFNTYNPPVGDIGLETAAFDGRYVYYVPNIASLNTTGTLFNSDSVVARYDTQGNFASSAAWSSYDMTKGGSIDSGLADAAPDAGAVTTPGYLGAVFDGRYLYFVPVGGALGPSGLVARYDTTASFDAGTSWTAFDLASVDPRARGFAGGSFDGRYVYFAPYSNGLADGGSSAEVAGIDGVVARLDTQGAFSAASSWSTFDTGNLDPHAVGYNGAVFDGRYMYFIPFSGNDIGFPAVTSRYDTKAPFDAGTSWSTFDTSGINQNAFFDSWRFVGGVFDGRYVYYIPSNTAPMIQYDTQGPFTDPDGGAWTVFDPRSLGASYGGDYAGAVFDGRYVYMVPQGYGVLARYDARDAGPLPDGSLRSFF